LEYQFEPSTFLTEADVEAKFIAQYLLPKLGYNLSAWYTEVAFGSIRLDFLAFANQISNAERPSYPVCLAIEAKSPKQKLDKSVTQIRQYLVALGIEWGVLTNGIDFRIYRRACYSKRKITLEFQCSIWEVPNQFTTIERLIGKQSICPRSPLPLPVTPTIQKNTKMKVIAVYHHKGGVGKTTTATNLAAALKNAGYRVLLIDLDAQSNTTFACGLLKFTFEEDDTIRDNNIYHLLESSDFNFIDDVKRQSDGFNEREIDVIPAHISLIEHQFQLRQYQASQTRLTKKLAKVEDRYDYVVIDSPPSLDIYAQIATISANYLLIPSDLRPFSNQGLISVRKFINEINEFRESLSKQPLHILGILPSKISTNPKFVGSVLPKQKAIVKEKYGYDVLDTTIFERAALSNCLFQSITVGDLDIPDPKSIFEYAKKNSQAQQAALEFEKLSNEIVKLTQSR